MGQTKKPTKVIGEIPRANDSDPASENAIAKAMAVEIGDEMEDAVRQVFDENKDYFVREVARKFAGRFAAEKSHGPVVAAGTGEWIPIKSLSTLRTTVGGRFDNLKKRWIEAGFPLKEHRGDHSGEYQINEKGWQELSNWLLKQGYEARLSQGSELGLFELRQISN